MPKTLKTSALHLSTLYSIFTSYLIQDPENEVQIPAPADPVLSVALPPVRGAGLTLQDGADLPPAPAHRPHGGVLLKRLQSHLEPRQVDR